MARTNITSTTIDLQEDNGNVLWSFIQGEQLEFPIILDFLLDTDGYTFEAVIVEALNVINQGGAPDFIKPGGIQTILVVRVPVARGAWNGAVAYNREDYVPYNNLFYKLKSGAGRISAVAPSSDPVWELYVPNKVYVQFPSNISILPEWTIQPTAAFNVYGFFELRVTEPTGGIYQKTWKPMRGAVELLFSPTELVV